MPFSSPNETVLHYERSGAGEALVLVHGSWVDGSTWDTVRPGLARSFEVVAFDRRGHAAARRRPLRARSTTTSPTWPGSSRGLISSPAHVAGASGGGSIVLRLAHDPQITHHDSYIEALEGFATGVTHG